MNIMSIFYFLAFFYVITIAIILLADDLTMTVAIMALVANMLTIAFCFNKMGSAHKKATSDTQVAPNTPTDSLQSTINSIEEVDQNPNLYGDKTEAHHIYDSTFNADPAASVVIDSPAELSNDYDSTNALLSRQRYQAKKAIDGHLVKTADYYQYQYANELAESEAKPWWGNTEF